MAINVVFAGIAVENYQGARTWHERLLGCPPDMLPHDTEAAWQLADAAWMYVVVDADRAGKALLTLIVDNLDQQVAALGERGIIPEAIETVPGRYHKPVVRDPEGNTISFAQIVTVEG